jgi:hypothetical protein
VDSLLEHLDRHLGRADRLHPLLRVPLRTQRIENPSDHRGHVEAPLRDLSDDDVGVIAVGGGDEGVGLFDPRGQQRIDLERGADREVAARVLPGSLEIELEACVRLGILIEARDLVSFTEHCAGNGRSDAAATTDQDEHRG